MDNKVTIEAFYKEIICNVENTIVHENILLFDMPPQWRLSLINNSQYVMLYGSVASAEDGTTISISARVSSL